MKHRVLMGHTYKMLREKKSLSVREVSVKSGVSIGYISEWERGMKEMSSELMSQLNSAIGVKHSEVLQLAYNILKSQEERKEHEELLKTLRNR